MKKINLINLIFLFAGLMIFNSCEEAPYNDTYDIEWPVPIISSISPKNIVSGNQVTINGSNLENLKEIRVGTIKCKIVSTKVTEAVILIPRYASTGLISVTHTIYEHITQSKDGLIISYPSTSISTWPDVAIAGQNLVIIGENVDLISSLTVNGEIITFDLTKAKSTTKITIPKASILGTEIIITDIVTANKDIIADSPTIPIKE